MFIMPVHVFTYGSLMFAPVWQRVVRGRYRSTPAHLDGHMRFAIRDETYPGMVASAGGRVDGVLYLDVAPADLIALDAFEGDAYRRDTVRVTLAGGEEFVADTYIYLFPQKLSDLPWIAEEFQMACFMGTYCRDKLGE